ncbi:hypothetical protein HN51_032053, partial [Arachis hypogaea]
ILSLLPPSPLPTAVAALQFLFSGQTCCIVRCYSALLFLSVYIGKYRGPNCCINGLRLELFVTYEPEASSTKNLIHLSQKNIQHYGQPSPPPYDMASIPKEFPLFFGYGGADMLADVKDVRISLLSLKDNVVMIKSEREDQMLSTLKIKGSGPGFKKMLWSAAKKFLNSKIIMKIQNLSLCVNYLKSLNLDFLGGSCTCPNQDGCLRSNKGPWNDPDIMKSLISSKSLCKSYEKAKKKLTIFEAPNVLTIALKRFQSEKFRKLNKPIQFSKTLDLAPFMINSQNKWFKVDDNVQEQRPTSKLGETCHWCQGEKHYQAINSLKSSQ